MHKILHHADPDGLMSAAIVMTHLRKRGVTYEDIETVPVNYGQDLLSRVEQGDRVYLVDFSIQPIVQFETLVARVGQENFVWIDHHETAIKASEQSAKVGNLSGLRRVMDSSPRVTGDSTIHKVAACELCHDYFFTDFERPLFLTYLGDWDTWRHADIPETRAVPTQHFFNSIPMTKEGALYLSQQYDTALEQLRAGAKDAVLAQTLEMCVKGEAIGEYVDVQNAIKADLLAFEGTFAGKYRAVFINAQGSSKLFDTVFDPAKHDLMVRYVFEKGGYFTVVLYARGDNVKGIHCGEVSKELGKKSQSDPGCGGGHAGAGGFQTTWLHFSTLVERDDGLII